MPDQTEYHAIIWDAGGVLVRTVDYQPRTMLAAKFGLSCRQLEDVVFNSDSAQMATVGKVDEEDHWQAVAARFCLDSIGLEKFKTEFWAGDIIDLELIDYIQAIRPAYRTGLLSNTWNRRRVLMGQEQLLEVFDKVIISAEVRLAKPDTRIYQLILEQLQVKPDQAIFVDDFQENLAAAERVGMKGIRFTSALQVMSEIDTLLNRSIDGS